MTQQTKKTGRAAAAVLWTLLPLALCALAVLSLGVGARPVSPDRVLAVLFFPDGSREALVVWQLRMPRTLLGIVAGAALGLAGGLMQALTRNPLADPGLVGVNAGAALCVVLAISLFGLTEYGATVGFALCGAGVASALVYVLGSGPREAGRQARLVLAGVAVSASFSAITSVITMLDSTAFDSYRFWVVGAVGGRDPAIVMQMLVLLAPAPLAGLLLARPLDALALGDDMGKALGLRPEVVLGASFVSIAVLAGGATAAVGPIGFVGLVVPHLIRLAVGPDWRRILPLCLVGGPVLLLGADTAGRVLAPPGEVEAGIVTAFLGAPLLLWLVGRRAGGGGR